MKNFDKTFKFPETAISWEHSLRIFSLHPNFVDFHMFSGYTSRQFTLSKESAIATIEALKEWIKISDDIELHDKNSKE